VCSDWWWKLNTCINLVSIICPLLVSCVGSSGLGLAVLVSRGGRVSQCSAVKVVLSFQVERSGGRRYVAVEGGSLFFVLVSQVGIWHQLYIWG
jgi:hypothetical protein